MNSPSTGYYSLIQYCPDRARLEAANVGVLLFAPACAFLQARLQSGNDRIRRFFHEEAGDLQQINAAKAMLAHRVEDEREGIRTLDELQRFICRFANELVFTEIRPVRVENPEVELAQLFEELVGGGRVRRDPPVRPQVAEMLRARMEAADLAPKVQRRAVTRIPILGKEIEADYAFMNGRRNLVQAKDFSRSREVDVMREVDRTAVEGHLLFKHPDAEVGAQQLIVVGSFDAASAQMRSKIEALLRDHEVELFTEDTLDSLVRRIRETAH